jgi:hypothetical protein
MFASSVLLRQRGLARTVRSRHWTQCLRVTANRPGLPPGIQYRKIGFRPFPTSRSGYGWVVIGKLQPIPTL